MNPDTRKIRQYLKQCTRKEYEDLIYASKLTPREEEALQCVILEGKSILEAGDILKCSGRTVSKTINDAYKKILKSTI